MAMDPMAASQGMFGGYGMNMNGMNSGMNMGMNFDAGQGMYGGWDGSQNNMWNGGQDKFNPNAFANGMGPQFGGPSGFGGYNMSQPNGNYATMQQQLQFPPNPDLSNGFHAPGYGRGGGAFRGRGRGFTPGFRGRAGYPGYMQANYPHNTNFTMPQNQNSPMPNEDMPSPNTTTAPTDDKKVSVELAPESARNLSEEPSKGIAASIETQDMPAEAMPNNSEQPADEKSAAEEDMQLRGIPTIDSIDEANAAQVMYNGPTPGMPGQMGPSFATPDYMSGSFPGGRGGPFPNGPFMPGPNHMGMPGVVPGQGVQGAPAAPRAMRQGLPNTSVLRQRGPQMSIGARSSAMREVENLPR